MVSAIFFRGATIASHGIKGIIPTLIRVCTRPNGWHLDHVPAHVIIFFHSGKNTSSFIKTGIEYEAVITGIRKQEFSYDAIAYEFNGSGIIDVLSFDKHTNAEELRLEDWLHDLEGERYGFEAVIATGIGNLEGKPPKFVNRIWEKLSSGRSSPKNCSVLCGLALEKLGYVFQKRKDGLPTSPVDLMIALRKIE